MVGQQWWRQLQNRIYCGSFQCGLCIPFRLCTDYYLSLYSTVYAPQAVFPHCPLRVCISYHFLTDPPKIFIVPTHRHLSPAARTSCLSLSSQRRTATGKEQTPARSACPAPSCRRPDNVNQVEEAQFEKLRRSQSDCQSDQQPSFKSPFQPPFIGVDIVCREHRHRRYHQQRFVLRLYQWKQRRDDPHVFAQDELLGSGFGSG